MIFNNYDINLNLVTQLKQSGEFVIIDLLNTPKGTNSFTEQFLTQQEAKERVDALFEILSRAGMVKTSAGYYLGSRTITKAEFGDSKIFITFSDGTKKTYPGVYEDVELISNAQVISGGGGSGGSGGELSKNIKATVDVGGIKKGNNFIVGTPIEDVLESLISPDVVASVSLTLSSPLVVKKGESVDSTRMTVSITKGTIDIDRAVFYVGSSIVYTKSGIPSGGNISFDYTNPISTDTTFKVVVSDIKGNSVTATKTVQFCNPFYYGNSAVPSISDFSGLTEDVSLKEKEKQASYTASAQYLVFAYDSSYGNLVSIKDPSNFENINAWVKTILTISGTSYNVYITADKITCSNFKYKFIY